MTGAASRPFDRADADRAYAELALFRETIRGITLTGALSRLHPELDAELIGIAGDTMLAVQLTLEWSAPDSTDPNGKELRLCMRATYPVDECGLVPTQDCVVALLRSWWEHELREGIRDALGDCVLGDPHAADPSRTAGTFRGLV